MNSRARVRWNPLRPEVIKLRRSGPHHPEIEERRGCVMRFDHVRVRMEEVSRNAAGKESQRSVAISESWPF